MAILKPTKTTVINGVKVNEYLLKNMYPSGGMTHVKGVTIHNTDWITTAEGRTPGTSSMRVWSTAGTLPWNPGARLPVIRGWWMRRLLMLMLRLWNPAPSGSFSSMRAAISFSQERRA